MAQRRRTWLVAVAAVIISAIVGVVILRGGGDSGSDLPRVRGSVPGLDEDLDLFADQSGRDEAGETGSDVIEVDSIDQIQAAFDADQGHPRLILLVDPI